MDARGEARYGSTPRLASCADVPRQSRTSATREIRTSWLARAVRSLESLPDIIRAIGIRTRWLTEALDVGKIDHPPVCLAESGARLSSSLRVCAVVDRSLKLVEIDGQRRLGVKRVAMLRPLGATSATSPPNTSAGSHEVQRCAPKGEGRQKGPPAKASNQEHDAGEHEDGEADRPRLGVSGVIPAHLLIAPVSHRVWPRGSGQESSNRCRAEGATAGSAVRAPSPSRTPACTTGLGFARLLEGLCVRRG